MKKIATVSIAILILIGLVYVSVRRKTKTFPPVHLASQLPAKYGEMASRKDSTYLIRYVNVLPMNRDTILIRHNVLIHNGRIQQIASDAHLIDTSNHPVGIDGEGKYLIPGLNDMHVHVNDENNLLLFIANGVTTVRNMAGRCRRIFEQ